MNTQVGTDSTYLTIMPDYYVNLILELQVEENSESPNSIFNLFYSVPAKWVANIVSTQEELIRHGSV